MKGKLRNFFLAITLPALGLALLLLLIDWFPLFGTLFTTPSSFAVTHGMITKSYFMRDLSFGTKYHAGYEICIEKIVYSYSIDGRNYYSERINFLSSDAFSCEEAQAYVKKYYEGRTVDVFYIPFFPRLSVLEPKNRLTIQTYLVSRFLPWYAIIFLCTSVPWMLNKVSIKRKPKKSRQTTQ